MGFLWLCFVRGRERELLLVLKPSRSSFVLISLLLLERERERALKFSLFFLRSLDWVDFWEHTNASPLLIN